MHFSVTFAENSEVDHEGVLQSVLGQGKVYVYQARFDSLNTDLALKVFTKQSGTDPHFTAENKFLSKLNHKSIIQYIPVVNHTLPHDIIATEYSPNGDFFDFVTKGGMTSEKLARTVFHQLVDGVSYLHSQNVAHVDIKLENLLIDKNYSLKIIDFDQAQLADDVVLKSGGTVNYRAPEVLRCKCKNLKAVDIYAMGVILYCFITGEMPFTESNGPKIPKTAKYETFCQNKEMFWIEKERQINKKLSPELKQLLNAMWEQDAVKRLKIEDITRTTWFNNEIFNEEESKTEIKSFFENLQIA